MKTVSPCVGCDLEFEDKNRKECRDCKKRIKYAFPHKRESELVNSQETQLSDKNEKIDTIEKKEKQKEYQRDYHRDVIARSKDTKRITINFADFPREFETLQKMAKRELRTFPHQAAWILMEALRKI